MRRIRSATRLANHDASPREHGGRIVFSWETLPEMRYPFIQRGYRIQHTWKQALLSAFKLHNDTWNVWTHLLGVCLFLVLLVHVCQMGAPTQIGEALGERLSAQLGTLKVALSNGVGSASGGEGVSSDIAHLSTELRALASRLMTQTEIQQAWGRVPSIGPSLLPWQQALAALLSSPFAHAACRTPSEVDSEARSTQ